jgi:[NiFe] hydrogenase assembly HybE family chaperone
MDLVGAERSAQPVAAPHSATPQHAVTPAGATVAEVARRVEQAFAHVQATRMHDVPFLNTALRVEAVGFRVWEGRYLGVLITPWFMNLLLLPQNPAQWRHVRYGDSLGYALPAGVFEFISALDAQLHDYQSCSLFSPMFEFADQDGARATAVAALEALFDAQTRAGAEGPGTSLAPLVDVSDGTGRSTERGSAGGNDAAAGTSSATLPAPTAPVSKRDFLRGRWHGTDEGSTR